MGRKLAKREWRCAVYTGKRSWFDPSVDLDDAGFEAMEAKALAQVGRKPGIEVVATLRGDGSPAPLDAGFQELCDMVVAREVDCVSVPDIRHFASNTNLAYFWVRDVMAPGGIRFLDASRRFDSATCDLDAYIWRLKSANKSIVGKPDGEVIVRKHAVPYGYVLDPSARGCMRVDEECAAVVVRIFEMAAAEVKCYRIARELEAEGIPDPSSRRLELYGDRTRRDPESGWNSAQVRNIIINPCYTGDFPKARRKKVAGGDWSMNLKDESMQFVYGHHEAIVTRDLYAKVRKVREARAAKHWPPERWERERGQEK